MEKVNKHQLNVFGNYYVDQDVCINHKCCVIEAPNNFKMDEETWQAYVFKQPATPEEEKQCATAMNICPVESIHNDG